jgi:hypothetical protein
MRRRYHPNATASWAGFYVAEARSGLPARRLHSVLSGTHGISAILFDTGGVDAVMLITTTAIAFLFAYKRKIALHRQWVTRSYAVALVFITGRFVMGVTAWELISIEIVQAIIWSCLALSILLADIANNWMEMRAALSANVRTEFQQIKICPRQRSKSSSP